MSILEALSPQGDDSPIFKFNTEGDRISGIIIEPPRVLPVNEYGTDQIKVDRHGNPVQQVLLVLATEQQDDPEHDGRWRVYIDKPLLKSAVFAAVRATGAADLAIGGELAVEYLGLKALQSGRSAKSFSAKYAPGTCSEKSHPIGKAELGETFPLGEPLKLADTSPLTANSP